MHAVFLGSSDVDWIKQLRSAGGISIIAAPDEYLNGDFEGETPLSLAWSNSVDAMMFACSEVEKLLTLPAKQASLPPPDSHLSGADEQPVTCDPDATAA